MRKFGIVFISIIIFILAGPVFLGFNIQKTLISSPDNIKQILVDTNAYERLTQIKAADLIALLQPENRDKESEIPEEMIQKAIDSITPQMTQRLVEQSLTAFYGSIQGGRDNFQIDLREIKQATLSTQPLEIKSEFEKAVPDFYVVNIPVPNNSIYSVIFSSVIRYSGLVIIALLSLIAILMGFRAKGKMATLGTVSLMMAIPLLTVYSVSSLIPFNSISTSSNNAISTEAFSLLRDLAKELWQIIATNIKNQGLIALGLAVLAYVIAIIIPGQKKPVAPAVASPAPATASAPPVTPAPTPTPSSAPSSTPPAVTPATPPLVDKK